MDKYIVSYNGIICYSVLLLLIGLLAGFIIGIVYKGWKLEYLEGKVEELKEEIKEMKEMGVDGSEDQRDF